MKYVKQFLVIVAITFVGELLNYFINLPIPASIYGIVILFCLLEFKILPLDYVKDVAHFLVAIMPIMFIPNAVRLMQMWDIIKPSWFAYLLVTLVSTVFVMAVSGWVSQGIIRLKGKKVK